MEQVPTVKMKFRMEYEYYGAVELISEILQNTKEHPMALWKCKK